MSEIDHSSDGYRWLVSQWGDTTPVRNYTFLQVDFCKEVSDRTKVFLDVGAHVGTYAVRMSRHYGRVLAFEPIPHNFSVLTENVHLNGCENVDMRQVAVGERDGWASMTGAGEVAQVKEGGETPVQMVKLDSVVDRADVVKIDVEGYEDNVLRGAERLLEQWNPILVVEYHGNWRKSPLRSDEPVQKLLANRYRVLSLREDTWVYVPKAHDLSKTPMLVFGHWLVHVASNLKVGRDWYFGLPYHWWWGMDAMEFVLVLRDHILNEDEWFTALEQDSTQ